MPDLKALVQSNRIMFIKRLLNEDGNCYKTAKHMINGRFMTREERHQKYNITCSIMFYNSLMASIPKMWKNKIRNEINNQCIKPTKDSYLDIKIQPITISFIVKK